jgi:fumarate reductase subunit C
MRPYIRHYPHTWWMQRRPYFLFMIREVSSIFVAGYCVFLIFFVYKLSQGPEAYYGVIELLKSPLSVILHIIAFLFAIYHSITWFNLTPKIFILRFGEEQVPAFLISGANFVAWVAISVVVAWIISVV